MAAYSKLTTMEAPTGKATEGIKLVAHKAAPGAAVPKPDSGINSILRITFRKDPIAPIGKG